MKSYQGYYIYMVAIQPKNGIGHTTMITHRRSEQNVE